MSHIEVFSITEKQNAIPFSDMANEIVNILAQEKMIEIDDDFETAYGIIWRKIKEKTFASREVKEIVARKKSPDLYHKIFLTCIDNGWYPNFLEEMRKTIYQHSPIALIQ